MYKWQREFLLSNISFCSVDFCCRFSCFTRGFANWVCGVKRHKNCVSAHVEFVCSRDLIYLAFKMIFNWVCIVGELVPALYQIIFSCGRAEVNVEGRPTLACNAWSLAASFPTSTSHLSRRQQRFTDGSGLVPFAHKKVYWMLMRWKGTTWQISKWSLQQML